MRIKGLDIYKTDVIVDEDKKTIHNPVNEVYYPTSIKNVMGLRSNIQPIKHNYVQKSKHQRLLDGEFTIDVIDITNNGIELIVDVVSEYETQIPSFTKLKYPKNDIQYLYGTPEFEVSWETDNASYVSIQIGNGSTTKLKQAANDTVSFNTRDLLDQFNILVSREGENEIPIYLTPINTKNPRLVEGETEVVRIRFSDEVINQRGVIDRITRGFARQFDKFEFDENQLLTHLLHTGDGNNQLITIWKGVKDDDLLKNSQFNKALVLKLYEELPDNIQVNDKVWISKLQSQTLIEEVLLSEERRRVCSPLLGPNIGLDVDGGVEYQNFEDLFVVGQKSSTELVEKYINKHGIDIESLHIEYTDDTSLLFHNFIHFSSAEERIKNFWYKLQVLEGHKAKLDDLITNHSSTSTQIEADNIQQKIDALIGGFDGFENFLYKDTHHLAFPKSGSDVKDTNSTEAKDWYNNTINAASKFDRNNVDYLNNNIPLYIKNNQDNEEFMLFLDMIGHHFDIIWMYINALTKLKDLHQPSNDKQLRHMINHMLESMGWEGDKAFEANYLWEYALGKLPDGTVKYSKTPKEASNEVWKRMLHNLPYLLKHKGTSRSVKAITAAYGIPNSLLTIMEFGGPHHPIDGEYGQYSFEDRTAAVHTSGTEYIQIPWKSVGGSYPATIEVGIKPLEITNADIISGDNFTLSFERISDNYAKLKFDVGGSDVESDPIKIPKDDYTSILINRNGGSYEVLLKSSNGYRIIRDVQLDLTAGSWDVGNNIKIGEGFDGIIDEVRLWKEPLEKSVFKSHTLFPDAINGNTETAYTEDLWFRLDFELPKNLNADTEIKNVAISEDYNEPFATAVGFADEPTYPHQYVPYDRTVTAKTPSVGFNYDNKIRFEDSELTGFLNYKSRATKRAYDRSPVDSNRLGLFLSANKELNMDVIKSVGPIHIGDYIGDPSYLYNHTYSSLDALRKDYFKHLNRNIYEYINLVKYIDKALFQNLEEVLPARSKTATGLLIEPHILERSKVRWNKPTSDEVSEEVSIEITTPIEFEHKILNAEITKDDVEFDYQMDNYEAIFETDFMEIEANSKTLFADISDEIISEFIGEYLTLEGEYIHDEFFFKTKETEAAISLTQVGMDDNSLFNAGFGLYGELDKEYFENTTNIAGLGIVKKLYSNGDLKIRPKYINKIKRLVKKTVMMKPIGEDEESLNNIDTYKYFVTLTDDPINIIGDNTFTPLIGYFKTHYIFVNGLSEGMRQSFFSGSKQTEETTPDGLPPVEVFATDPNVLKVADTGRTRGEPILRTK